MRRSGAVLLIGSCAAVGALLLTVSAWLSVAIPAVLALAAAVGGDALIQRHAIKMRSRDTAG